MYCFLLPCPFVSCFLKTRLLQVNVCPSGQVFPTPPAAGLTSAIFHLATASSRGEGQGKAYSTTREMQGRFVGRLPRRQVQLNLEQSPRFAALRHVLFSKSAGS